VRGCKQTPRFKARSGCRDPQSFAPSGSRRQWP